MLILAPVPIRDVEKESVGFVLYGACFISSIEDQYKLVFAAYPKTYATSTHCGRG